MVKTNQPRNVKHQRKRQKQKESHGIYTLPWYKNKKLHYFSSFSYFQTCVCWPVQPSSVWSSAGPDQLHNSSNLEKLPWSWSCWRFKIGSITLVSDGTKWSQHHNQHFLYARRTRKLSSGAVTGFKGTVWAFSSVSQSPASSASLRILVWNTICWRSFQFKQNRWLSGL